MEFKFRAVDNKEPPPITSLSHSLSPLTYLPDQSLYLDGCFSGLRMPLSGEAALRREIEKELIRREILRRSELEEEVRRELAMEKELGISLPRPLMNIQGLMSHWSNSSVMNPAAVGHIDALQSQPQSILPPAEINPSPETCDKGKVIVLDKPDPKLFNAKRKATTPPDSEIEPLAFSLKKKSKEEWSCALCEIKATSESGLNAHLNGKKHKAREAGQNRKIAKRNKKSRENVMVVETDVTTTKLVVHAEKDQQLLQLCTALEVKNETAVDQQLLQPCTALEVMNETAVDQQFLESCTALEVMNETTVDKGVGEIKKEEQLVKTVSDNDASATESKNEKFVAMMVDKNITELKNEEQLVETTADNSVMWKVKPINENELVEMMVSNDVVKFENRGLVVEKSQNVGSLESKKDAAMEEAEPISALTKKRKFEPLWCEICQISTSSKAVMECHVKGKKHMKKMKKFGQNSVSPPSTSSVSQKAPPMLIKDALTVNKETG
ncbi:unnamed protein product [Lathyrus sativus]|nr:unnamed protein product [Lathyrus sativus]